MLILVPIVLFIQWQLVTSYDHRSLTPGSLRKKLCDKDESILLCKIMIKPDIQNNPNRFYKYSICTDNPHLRICRRLQTNAISVQKPIIDDKKTVEETSTALGEIRSTTEESLTSTTMIVNNSLTTEKITLQKLSTPQLISLVLTTAVTPAKVEETKDEAEETKDEAEETEITTTPEITEDGTSTVGIFYSEDIF